MEGLTARFKVLLPYGRIVGEPDSKAHSQNIQASKTPSLYTGMIFDVKRVMIYPIH
jgi:hypothetical protein